jgi:hypothetical protein
MHIGYDSQSQKSISVILCLECVIISAYLTLTKKWPIATYYLIL